MKLSDEDVNQIETRVFAGREAQKQVEVSPSSTTAPPLIQPQYQTDSAGSQGQRRESDYEQDSIREPSQCPSVSIQELGHPPESAEPGEIPGKKEQSAEVHPMEKPSPASVWELLTASITIGGLLGGLLGGLILAAATDGGGLVVAFSMIFGVIISVAIGVQDSRR